MGRLLALLGLWSIAAAQPVTDVISKSPETFVVLDADRTVTTIWILVVHFAVPLALLGAEQLASQTSQRLAEATRTATVGLIAAVFIGRTMSDQPSLVAALVSVAGGIGLGVAVERWQDGQTWATYTSVTVALSIGLFAVSPSADVLRGSAPELSQDLDLDATPVVLVILDELPTASLLDGSGNIDTTLFPGFARLAATSTWYRNATTVSPRTTDALPAILTGSLPPADGRPAVAASHPPALFSMLADSHSTVAFEQITRLCAGQACGNERTARRFDSVRELLRQSRTVLWSMIGLGDDSAQTFVDAPFDEAAPERIDRFIDQLDARPGTLNVLHTMFPHGPHLHTGEGIAYNASNFSRGLFEGRWLDETSAVLGRQRHLEQVRLADAKISALLDRLEDRGQLDDALIVVTADHGIAFQAKEPDRGLSAANASEVLWVPLFVKYPGGQGGVVDDAPARTVDIVPTILDVLDGGSLLSRRGDEPPPFDGDMMASGRSLLWPAVEIETLWITDWGRSTLRPSRERFAEISVEPAFDQLLATQPLNPSVPGVDGLYALGPFGPALFGKPVADFPQGDLGSGPGLLEARYAPDAQTKSRRAPLYVSGFIERPPSDEFVAVSVGGVIAAVVPTSLYNGLEATSWWTLLPERFAGDGIDDLGLHLVSGTPTKPSLTHLTVGIAD